MPNDDSKSIEKSVARLRECLATRGLRYTAEREAILRYVLGCRTRCTPRQVCDGIGAAGMHVSLATVYNTLNLLADCGLVAAQNFNGRQSFFEGTAHVQNHHQLVCTHCGKVKEVRDPGINPIIQQHKYRTFTTHYYTLTVMGVCSTCSRKMRKSHINK